MRDIAGCTVRLWTDNQGGEGALRRGSAKAHDHNAVVHAAWLMAAANSIGLFVGRVPSALNVSDGPTRPEGLIASSILSDLGAEWREPWLPGELWRPRDWANVMRYL
jgi:hypothetical protein